MFYQRSTNMRFVFCAFTIKQTIFSSQKYFVLSPRNNIFSLTILKPLEKFLFQITDTSRTLISSPISHTIFVQKPRNTNATFQIETSMSRINLIPSNPAKPPTPSRKKSTVSLYNHPQPTVRASPLHLKPASPGAAATATAATRTILTTSARAPPPFPQSATQPRKAPLLLLPPTSLLTALSSRLYNDIIFMAHAPPGGNKGVAAAVYLYIHTCVCVCMSVGVAHAKRGRGGGTERA